MLLGIGTAVAICLWAAFVPYRNYGTKAFLEQQGFETIPTNPKIRRLITWAKLNFLIYPSPTGRDTLIFVRAKENSEVLYLFFKPAHLSNTAVVYAYDSKTRKSIWRTEVGTDDD
jgi:hypothetical protein